MQISEQVIYIIQKWDRCTAHEKGVVIKAFLHEYGEHATWEEWLAFLHRKKQENVFEWTKSVD